MHLIAEKTKNEHLAAQLQDAKVHIQRMQTLANSSNSQPRAAMENVIELKRLVGCARLSLHSRTQGQHAALH